MPYKTNRDLPENVKRHLPQHAQDIYREAFNHAWERYKDPDKRRKDASHEGTAHRVAWSAVERTYEKRDGEWRKKDKESRKTPLVV
jgi:cation transport regulator